MGDSTTSTEVVVAGEKVVKEESSSFSTVTKHTVTSVQTSHMETSHESTVHVGSIVQQAAAATAVTQQAVTHQEVSQTQSITATGSAAETKAVEEAPPPAIEPQPVDENANSIPDEPPAAEPTPVSAAEPIPEPAAEPSPEPAAEPAAEPVLVPEAEPTPEPAAEPVPVPEAEPAPEPVAEAVPEPEPVAEPIPEAEIIAEPAPEPVVEPIPEAETIAEPASELVSEAQEISQENIKTQLHEIISEIEQEVLPEQDEEGTLHHTWRPRGKYELQKTEVLYEDVVPIKLAEVVIEEPPKPQPIQQIMPDQQEPMPQMMVAHVIANNMDGMTNGICDPEELPLEIPEGIPLLARVLPKTEQGLEGEKKISLERLFTPATDSGDLTPIKKKAFASSAFYRPDHPTIDDQVELAQRISFSLVDENNKMSRGQSMYMKRKKRSMRWVHQGEEGDEDWEGPAGYEILEEEPGRVPEKPAMKLLMSSKGVQDFQQVQEHYQNLMNQSPQSPDISKIVTEVSSPTGKGAELFAKRKKRMDKFIVDETTVQKSQQTSLSQQSVSSSSSFSSSSQNITSGVSVGTPAAAPGSGAMYTAEVKVVQRASLPPTPVDLPHHNLLDLVEEEKSDRRLSASFNLAAKGWGTYNKFYTPISFSTKS